MNFLELAQNRYTTKRYNPKKKISNAQIEELKEILRLAPSSVNSQPWKFIFVSDEDIKRQLASASFINEQSINDASHLVVFNVDDDIAAFESRLKENVSESFAAYFTHNIKLRGEVLATAWMENQVYLALGFFLSACAAMGIDSTPMEGIQPDKYKEVLQLDRYRPIFAVTIGYRDENDFNQPLKNPKSRLPLEEAIASI